MENMVEIIELDIITHENPLKRFAEVKVKGNIPEYYAVLLNYHWKIYLAELVYKDGDVSLYRTKELPIELNLPSFNISKSNSILINVYIHDVKNDITKYGKKAYFEVYLKMISGGVKYYALKHKEQLQTTVPKIIAHWNQKKMFEKILLKLNPPKTKVHFTIGIFFDGTCNNSLNSDQKYYKNVNNKTTYLEKIPKFTKINTSKGEYKIENASSYWNPYSNVALLHDLYKEDNKKEKKIIKNDINIILKQYVTGIGTITGKEDDQIGYALGEGENGIIGKVTEGSLDLAKQIAEILGKDFSKEIGSLTFDVFGFSRGAAAARHFCNEILGDDSVSIQSFYKKDDELKTFTLGVFGKALKSVGVQSVLKQTYGEKLKKDKVTIRFVGLFDTVVSQMVVKENLGIKASLATLATVPLANILSPLGALTELSLASVPIAIQLSLKHVKQNLDGLGIQYIFHIVAADEFRVNFASTPLNKEGCEIKMIGAHSDIGGGYAAEKYEINTIDYQEVSYYEGQTIPEPKTLQRLMGFYKSRGYCGSKEISISEVETTDLEPNPDTGATRKSTLFQLMSKREILPRLSTVSLKVMKVIALKCSVPLLLDEKAQLHSFEYELSTLSSIDKVMLHKYFKNIIELAVNDFDKIYKLSKKKEKKVKEDEKAKKYICKKYVHLSSNYNMSKIIEKKGKGITGAKIIDKELYVNSPRYKNSSNDDYEREIYVYQN